jgi:preprotein translocase subunit YajC
MAELWPLIAFMVLLFVMFYFLMIRPQRKRQREHEDMVHSLRKGDKIITAGGIYGQVESVNQDNALIKVESGATIRISLSSIASKQERT